MPQLPLRLAAASFIVGGLALGVVPMPLSDFGCPAALGSDGVLDSSTDVVLACADDRSERQTAVGLLLTVGVAGLAASLAPRRRAEVGASDATTPTAGSAPRQSRI